MNTTQILDGIKTRLFPHRDSFRVEYDKDNFKIVVNDHSLLQEVDHCKHKACPCHYHEYSPSKFAEDLEYLMVMIEIMRRNSLILPRSCLPFSPHMDKGLVNVEVTKGEEPIPVTTDTAPTTEFIDNAASGLNQLGHGEIPNRYDSRFADIRSFLAKPYLYSNQEWSTSQAAMTNLLVLDYVNILNANTYYQNKFQGFNLIRATAVIRVTINANPFQQGKLLLSALPAANVHAEVGELSYGSMHTNCLAAKTQLPNIEIDCRESSIVMKMPYVTPYLFYDLKATDFDLATFYLDVLSPLKTGSAGDTSVDVNVWVSLEDVEMAAPLIPQMNRIMSFGETREMSNGTISGGLLAASSVMSKMNIPSIPTKQLAWATAVAGNLASAFGWSKPTNDNATTTVSTIFDRHTANCDGPSQAVPLGLSFTNSIAPTNSLSFVTQDEMSFDFLKQIPAFYDTLPWNKSDTEGVSLLGLSVIPTDLAKQFTFVNTKTYTYAQGAPFWYLSNFFTFFRGSIIFRFKIVKTDFHSGRLLVTFTPNHGSVTVPNVFTSVLAMREIIDIRTGTEFEVTLPYYLPTMWTSTLGSIGTLQVLIQNELRSPETAADNIDILVYVRAGPDFELAVPGITASNNLVPFAPHGNDELVSTTIGNQIQPTRSLNDSTMVIGESFNSIKQLLNRYGLLTYVPTHTSPLYIDPWYFGVARGGTTALQSTWMSSDWYAITALMYAYSRGSMRIMVSSSDVEASNSSTEAYILPGAFIDEPASAPMVSSAATNFSSLVGVPAFPNTNGFLSLSGWAMIDRSVSNPAFHIPFYNDTPLRTNYVNDSSHTNTFTAITSHLPRLALKFDSFSQSAQNVAFHRACGEDFQFTVFVGAPPLLVTIT